jgi:hypothetical protein
VSSAVDLRNVSENFGADILNNLNSVKKMLKKGLPLSFIPMKFKEILARNVERFFCFIKL